MQRDLAPSKTLVFGGIWLPEISARTGAGF